MHFLLAVFPNWHLITLKQIDSIIRATWLNTVHQLHFFDIMKRSRFMDPMRNGKLDTPCIVTLPTL